MKHTQGQCKYCKQFMAIEVPDSWEQEEIDEAVTDRCDCPEAKAKQRIYDNIANTEAAIKAFFEHKNELKGLRDLLLSMVKPMAEGSISKVSIGKDEYVGSMRPTKDGIKITLKYSTEDSIES